MAEAWQYIYSGQLLILFCWHKWHLFSSRSGWRPGWLASRLLIIKNNIFRSRANVKMSSDVFHHHGSRFVESYPCNTVFFLSNSIWVCKSSLYRQELCNRPCAWWSKSSRFRPSCSSSKRRHAQQPGNLPISVDCTRITRLKTEMLEVFECIWMYLNVFNLWSQSFKAFWVRMVRDDSSFWLSMMLIFFAWLVSLSDSIYSEDVFACTARRRSLVFTPWTNWSLGVPHTSRAEI